MIALGLALALQAGSAPAGDAASAAGPAKTPAVRVTPIDPAQAVDLFKGLCLPNLGDEAAFAAAMAAAPIPFASVRRRDARPGQTWRADRALVNYGPGPEGSVRCTLVGRLKGSANQLTFSARVAEALGLNASRTRTARDQAVTDWTFSTPEGQPVLVSVATRNAMGGGSDIRLSAVLIARESR